MSSLLDDDEAIARALQEEYEREYRRRSMQQHLRQTQERNGSAGRIPPPSAPPHSSDVGQGRRSRSTSNNDRPMTSIPQPTAPVEGSAVHQSQRERRTKTERSPSRHKRQHGAPDVEVALTDTQRRSHHGSLPTRTSPQTPHRSLTSATSRGNDRKTTQQRREDEFPSNENPPPFAPFATDAAWLSDQEFERSIFQQLETKTEKPKAERTKASTRPYASRFNDNNPSSSEGVARSGYRTDYGSPSLVPTTGVITIESRRMLSDEELARRLAQEEQDAVFAQRFAADERATVRGVPVVPKKTFLSRCFSSVGRLVSCLVTFCMLAIAAGLLWWYFGGSDSMPDFMPDPEAFRKEDPFFQNPQSSNRWKNDGSGLDLTLINALDAAWNDYFYKAVSDWDAGNPDSLNLKTELGTPDFDCTPQPGYIKVCNGDYGPTNWRGINKVLLERGENIYASSARMNEFYFSGEDVFQRQYTMCHEIGHGFGLPHSDENFYNKDLGNCMDYTNQPENNMSPNEQNYKFLADLYGSLDGSYIQSGNMTIESSVVVAPSDPSTDPPCNENCHGGKARPDHKDEGGRMLRSRVDLITADQEATRLRMIRLSEDIDRLIDTSVDGHVPNGRRVLGSTDSDVYEVDLGGGYAVRYHMLLVR